MTIGEKIATRSVIYIEVMEREACSNLAYKPLPTLETDNHESCTKLNIDVVVPCVFSCDSPGLVNTRSTLHFQIADVRIRDEPSVQNMGKMVFSTWGSLDPRLAYSLVSAFCCLPRLPQSQEGFEIQW